MLQLHNLGYCQKFYEKRLRYGTTVPIVIGITERNSLWSQCYKIGQAIN